MAEWFKAPVLKTGRGFTLPRGFESHPFRHLAGLDQSPTKSRIYSNASHSGRASGQIPGFAASSPQTCRRVRCVVRAQCPRRGQRKGLRTISLLAGFWPKSEGVLLSVSADQFCQPCMPVGILNQSSDALHLLGMELSRLIVGSSTEL